MAPKRKKLTLGGASKGPEKVLLEGKRRKKKNPKRVKTNVSILEEPVAKETPGTSSVAELPKEQTPAHLPEISRVAEIPREQTSAEELPGLSEVTKISTEQTPADEPPGFSRVKEFPGVQTPEKGLPGTSNIVEIPKDRSNGEQRHDENDEVMKKDGSQQKENGNSDKNNDMQADQQEKEKDAKQGTSQTNLQTTGELGGVVFMCNSQTKPECYKYMIMAFPDSKRDLVLKIRPESKLFLFDYHEKLLYGIYKPASLGGLRIEPAAFNGSFPAQVRFRVDRECSPLPVRALGEFSENLASRPSSLKCELTIEQVARLSALFIQNTPDPRSLVLNPNAHAGADTVVRSRPFQPGQMDPMGVHFNPNLQARVNTIVPPRPFVPVEMAFNPRIWAGVNAIMPPRPRMAGRMDPGVTGLPFGPGEMDPRVMAHNPNIQSWGMDPRVMNLPFGPGVMDPRVMARGPNIQAWGNVIVPPRPSVPGQPVLSHQHLGGVPVHQMLQVNFPHAANVPAPRPASCTPAPASGLNHGKSGSTQMDSRLATDKDGRLDATTVSKEAAAPSLTDVALSNLSLLSASYRQAPNPQPQHPAPAPKQPPASAPSHTPSHDAHTPGLIQDVAMLGSQQLVLVADSQLLSSGDRRYSLTQVPAEAALKPSAAPGSPRRKLMAADWMEPPGHGREVGYGDRIADRSNLNAIDKIPAVPAVKAPLDYGRRQQQRAGGNLDVDSLPVSSRYSFDGPSVKYR